MGEERGRKGEMGWEKFLYTAKGGKAKAGLAQPVSALLACGLSQRAADSQSGLARCHPGPTNSILTLSMADLGPFVIMHLSESTV